MDHLLLFQFIKYVQKQAYLNQIPFNDFINLLNMLLIVHPCKKCRRLSN